MISSKKLNMYDFGKTITPYKFLSLKYSVELENLYEKVNFKNFNYAVISKLFFLSLLLSVCLYLFSYEILLEYLGPYLQDKSITGILSVFATFFAYSLAVYYCVLLGYLLYNNGRYKVIEEDIERDLPEFIDNLVSNLKGGVSIEKAILKSVRYEQKSLLREVTLINEKIMMGDDVSKVLEEFRARFSSPVINRTFLLIGEGVRGGGNLTSPLERISENLKRVYFLDEEIKNSSAGFSMVIRGIALVLAPLLFALALTILIFIRDLFNLLNKSGGELGSFTSIPQEFVLSLEVFSYAMICLITIFSCLITSQLKNERQFVAFKYIPFYLIFVILLFNLISGLLIDFFGNII